MKNRIADFKKFWVFQLMTKDCDTSLHVLGYIIERMELNIEQKYWICWIYANTYQIATTWVIFNEFPDFENVDIDRLREWEISNKDRLPYQKDQKWLRCKLHETYLSYRSNIYLKNNSQREFFAEYEGKFENLYDKTMSDFYRFGRYTSWFYLQSLHEICGINLQPTKMQLQDKSTRAPRSGLCYALGHNSWAEEKRRKFDKKEIKYLEYRALLICVEVHKSVGHFKNVSVNLFSMETALCAFYKLFRRSKGRYLGYYLDRMAEDIHKTSQGGWSGINWDLLWEFRQEKLPSELLNNNGVIDKEKQNLYLDTGETYYMGSFLDKLNKSYEGS
jgi:hypothetical protein